MKNLNDKIEKGTGAELAEKAIEKGRESGIVVPVILWWLGLPATLLIVLYLVGVF